MSCEVPALELYGVSCSIVSTGRLLGFVLGFVDSQQQLRLVLAPVPAPATVPVVATSTVVFVLFVSNI